MNASILRSLLAALFVSTVAFGAPADHCDLPTGGDVPPKFQTLFMLNGVYWANASEEIRSFYVRIATKIYAVDGPTREHRRSVGWTTPQMVAWITEFYEAHRELEQLPVALAFGYAHRASFGEEGDTLLREAKEALSRIEGSRGT